MRANSHARKAKRRASILKIRKLAPRHPKAPEARIKLALARVFRKYHKTIKERILSIAPHHLNFYGPKKNDRERSESASVENKVALQIMGLHVFGAKHTAEFQTTWGSYLSSPMARQHRRIRQGVVLGAGDINPGTNEEAPYKEVQDPVVSSVLHSIWNEGRYLLSSSGYKRTTLGEAQKTAKSVNEQVRKAITVPVDYDPDFESHIAEMSDSMYDSAAYYVAASVNRAESVLDTWTDLDPDTSPRAGDLDSLGSMLDAGLTGVLGSALLSVALQFGDSFADMVRGAGTEAGVERYMWVTQHDSRVRPAHAALDGETFNWDDPGLKANDSDNEEDDFPGDDFGCRCLSGLAEPGSLN